MILFSAYSLIWPSDPLQNYWRKGPGYTINYEQACPLLTEMFAEIDKVTEKVAEKEQR